MPTSLLDAVRERGPITVASFMQLALYSPQYGYYARAAQRSGRQGDFFTSVDVGAVFGELLEVQLAEMAGILGTAGRSPNPDGQSPFDLVEAGAGNGRLSADILRAAKRRHPEFFTSIRLHLVEASATARAAERATLGEVADRLATSSDALPEAFTGVLLANELLDAMPVHQVVMRPDGLHEVYVAVSPTGPASPRLVLIEGPPSTPAIAAYLERAGAALEPGWRAEVNLAAVDWMREAARRLRRGFIVVIDYGHEARELYSASHAGGTLTTFTRHMTAGAGSDGERPEWLQSPGEHDITAHVDFTSVRRAGEAAGLTTLGYLDQTYFLLGILGSEADSGARDTLRHAGRLKTLLLPGGLGSTHKVLIFGNNVGHPPLVGCSFRMRAT